MRLAIRIASFLAGLAVGVTSLADHPVLQGVTALEQSGVHSPVIADGPEWTALVAGGGWSWFSATCGPREFRGPAPLVAAARPWGSGRIILSSRDWSVNLANNATFRANATEWLANGRPGGLAWTTGHSEWLGGSPAAITQLAGSMGRTATAIPGTVTPKQLESIAVLFVTDPWGAFAETERIAIMQWVEEGGGLWVDAVGWSWNAYHPGSEAEIDHPATRLLAGTGGYVAPSFIEWPEGTPRVFDRLGDDAHTGSAAVARDRLISLHVLHGPNLGAILEQDPAARATFVDNHAVLSWGDLLGLPAERTAAARDACLALLLAFPASYGRQGPIPASQPIAMRGRERLWRTLTDISPDSQEARTFLADLANWTGSRRVLYRDHGIVLIDNQRSSPAQHAAILDWVAGVPEGKLALEAITFNEWLPPAQVPIDLSGPGCQVNVFNLAVGSQSENPFPSGVPARPCDIFASVAAHEVMHAVDATWIAVTPSVAARKSALIADAGTDPLNYLRSMFPPGFFTQNPQEFMASIANQWVSESYLCLRLGRLRFEAGRRQPIEQALFMTEVFSNGDAAVLFRGSTSAGPIAREASLVRDGDGRIREIRDGTTRFEFQYGGDGHVSGVTESSDDCNGNGLADAMEILAGTAPDADADMVPDTCLCPADLDRDGTVGPSDLSILLGHWGSPSMADLDRNGSTEAADLLMLLSAWGPCEG